MHVPRMRIPAFRRQRRVEASVAGHPEPDLRKLVRALIQLVRDETETLETSDAPRDAAA